MKIPRCCLCGKTLLGLVGQDYLYEEYYLRMIGFQKSNDPLDQEVIDNRAAGYCHYICMTQSRWGEIWSQRTKEHYLGMNGGIGGFEIVAFNNAITIMYRYQQPIPGHNHNPNFDSLCFIKSNGWIKRCDVGSLRNRIFSTEGWLISNPDDFELDLSDNQTLAIEIKANFSQKGFYPLQNLIKAFEIADKLIYPNAIKNAVLRPSEKEVNSSANWVSATCEYEWLLPNDVIDLLPQQFM